MSSSGTRRQYDEALHQGIREVELTIVLGQIRLHVGGKQSEVARLDGASKGRVE